ncbi:MAG: TOBE domain-containing protein, partial [Gemmatimonadetes bacterium]|nr:TOBE domain-containing protein [Gemmatimonadota bacterium]NIT68759.1 TOBE domain-containing protein [Gemmatimonadota bacterium]NIW74385.1 TOBE domain-containing protein [Gemmatimonadota bacterium]NIY37336.1 TOBE domain-containing protein [Gemmatimonadota bacterium]
LPAPNGIDAAEGKGVIYGVRPEHVDLGGEDGVPAEVRVVEPTGAYTLAFVHLAGT